MSVFAKIFDSELYGQILVKIDDGESGPEVRVFFQPDGLGVCSLAFGFEDSDVGWDKAEAAFEKTDLAFVEDVVAKAIPPELLGG